MDRNHIDALRRTYGGPMSEEEVKFLRDIQGFIDFGIRNGLSFPLVVGTLSHDVSGLARLGFSLDAKQAGFFAPKTSGFADSTADAVGVPEDLDD